MRRSRLIVTLVLIVAIGLVAAPSAAGAPITNGRIYYLRFLHGPDRFVSVLPDGTGSATSFVDGAHWTSIRMALSPDGTRVALAQYHASWNGSRDRSRLVIVDAADGGNLVVTQPSDDTFYSSVAWMPSGTRLLFSRASFSGGLSTAGYRLYGVDVNGSTLARVRVHTHVFEVGVSPDGTRIAYTDGKSRLGVANVDGSAAQLITARAYDPSWSPDGTELLFSRKGDLFTIAPDGTALTDVRPTPKHDDAWPAWSPDGTRIVYTRLYYNGGAGALFTVGADGAGVERVTDTTFKLPGFPQWAPA